MEQVWIDYWLQKRLHTWGGKNFKKLQDYYCLIAESIFHILSQDYNR